MEADGFVQCYALAVVCATTEMAYYLANIQPTSASVLSYTDGVM